MSSKNRTRTSRTANVTTTDDATRALRSVPEQVSEPVAATKARTETEDKLWATLHANPDSTVAELFGAAGIGKSTAAKILAKWADDGSVTRIGGIAEGGGRAADRWTITEHDSARPTDVEPMPVVHTDTPPMAAVPIDAVPTDVEPADADTASEPADGDTLSDDGGSGKSRRLAPGALRGLVEDYLNDHPGKEFSPNAIGKALKRSSGAVNNALEKLVGDGYAVRTKDAPKRFAIAAAGSTTASDATTN